MTNTKDNSVPKTIKELSKWMKDECLNEHSYSIGGKPAPFEGFVLNPKGNHFEWYYTERGRIEVLETFDNEEDACKFAFEQMKNDRSSKTHLVGFLNSDQLQKKLCREIAERGFEFRRDKIPFDVGIFKYRVFVYGCDHKQVEDLSLKYKDLDK